MKNHKLEIFDVWHDGTAHVLDYAWPGGYPLFYVTDSDDCLCPECVASNLESIGLAHNYCDSGWNIVGIDTNWEDPNLYCDNCSSRIFSAYAEDQATFPGASCDRES